MVDRVGVPGAASDAVAGDREAQTRQLALEWALLGLVTVREEHRAARVDHYEQAFEWRTVWEQDDPRKWSEWYREARLLILREET